MSERVGNCAAWGAAFDCCVYHTWQSPSTFNLVDIRPLLVKFDCCVYLRVRGHSPSTSTSLISIPPLSSLIVVPFVTFTFHHSTTTILSVGHTSLHYKWPIIMYSTPPPAPHPPANISLHLLWYKLIVVCCFLIFHWSYVSKLTIPAQTTSPWCLQLLTADMWS